MSPYPLARQERIEDKALTIVDAYGSSTKPSGSNTPVGPANVIIFAYHRLCCYMCSSVVSAFLGNPLFDQSSFDGRTLPPLIHHRCQLRTSTWTFSAAAPLLHDGDVHGDIHGDIHGDVMVT